VEVRCDRGDGGEQVLVLDNVPAQPRRNHQAVLGLRQANRQIQNEGRDSGQQRDDDAAGLVDADEHQADSEDYRNGQADQ